MSKNTRDSYYKQFFSHPEVVASLLRTFLPEKLASQIDVNSLKPWPTEQFTHDGQKRFSDLVWQVKIANSDCFIMLMLEFQSKKELWMPLRILEYTVLLWRSLAKTGYLNKKRKLPPVLPIVIYTGGPVWNTPKSIRDLVSHNLKELEPYQPFQDFQLLDLWRLSLDKLKQAELAALLFSFERAKSYEAFIKSLSDLCKLIGESQPDLQRLFLAFFSSYYAFADNELAGKVGACKSLEEAYNMVIDADLSPVQRWRAADVAKGHRAGRREGIAEGIIAGRKEGRAEGIAEGIITGRKEGRAEGIAEGIITGRAEGLAEGIKNILSTTLATRFGQEASERVKPFLDACSDSQLLTDLALKAWQLPSLEEFEKSLPQ